MTDPDRDDLEALRRRAYSREADIHLDPASLARLDALENARPTEPADDPPPDPSALLPDTAVPTEALADEPLPDPWLRPRVARALRWLRGLRRSTVLIALGVAVIVATLLTALTVVQRVQIDPLQVGAVQVARLAVDGGYVSPFVDYSVDSGVTGRDARGYEAFYGLRATTGPAFFYAYGSAAGSECLTIYVESTLEVQGNGISGSLFSSCAAGDFPAMLQFPVDFPELPEELREAFPDAGGLQFVYDPDDDEVVVFADR